MIQLSNFGLWEHSIIKALQSLRSDTLDAFMLFVTQFGDQIFLLIVAVILLYVVGQRQALKFLVCYFVGFALVGFLKVVIARPRPYTNAGIESVGEMTLGYSMPSGHTYSITNISAQMFGSNSIIAKKKFVSNQNCQVSILQKGVCTIGILLSVLVAFSRMYLGQHYLTDVLVGGAIAVVTAIVVPTLITKFGNVTVYMYVTIAILSVIFGIIFCSIGRGQEIVRISGAIAGLFGGYILEKCIVKYSLNRDGLKSIFRVLIGGGVALSILLLRTVLPNNIFWFDLLAYVFATFWATFLAFLLFKKINI